MRMNKNISTSESESDNKEDLKERDDDLKPLDSDEASKRVHNALKKLHTSYNPTLSALLVKDDLALVNSTDNLHGNPMTFDQA